MLGAIRLQERRGAPRARRALAAVTCIWFVLGGVLGRRHEATVAHVVDPLTGEIHHTSAQHVAHHTSQQSDYHAARPADIGDDVCPISTTLHQAADAGVAHAFVASVEWVADAAPVHASAAVAARAVFRFAPKTSPPQLA